MCDLFTEGAQNDLLIFHMDKVDLRDNCKEMLSFRGSFEMRIKSAEII